MNNNIINSVTIIMIELYLPKENSSLLALIDEEFFAEFSVKQQEPLFPD